MKVDRIKYFKDGFAAHIMDEASAVSMEKYDLLQQWSDNWDIDDLDLYATMQKSLNSKISGQIWGGSVDSMKSEMLAMIRQDKEYIRSTFHNYFQEGKDLGLRVDRFLHHLDEIYRYIKRSDRKAVSHYHTRSTAIVYLAAAYPTQYCLHQYSAFATMMHALEARNIPEEHEIERYYKSLRGIYKVLTADPVVEQAVALRCAAHGITYIPSLLVMNDYMDYVVSNS